VQHQLEQLLQAGLTTNDIFVHTNALYYSQYHAWATSVGIPERYVFNNQIRDNNHRRGAVGDLRYALQRIGKNDLIVLASDTLLFSGATLFDLGLIIRQYQQDGISRIIVYEGESHKLSLHGIVQIDSDGKVVGFEEKPAVPKSNLINASVHLYTPKIVNAILQSKLEPRAESGMLIAHLYPSFPIYVEKADSRLDIGTVEDVIKANIQGAL